MKLKSIGLCAAALGLVTVLAGAPVGQTASAVSMGPGPGTQDKNISQNTVVGAESYFDPDPKADPTEGAKAKSTAEFTVVPSTLQLVAVPDMNFGEVQAKDVMDGGNKPLVDSKVSPDGVSKGKTAFDGNNMGAVIVRDYRGVTGGWTLSLAMNPTFDDENSASPLNGLSLDIGSINGTNSFGDTINMSGSQIQDQNKVISTAEKDKGQGSTEYTLGGGSASLVFPGSTNRVFEKDSAYQSDLTWTLVAGQ